MTLALTATCESYIVSGARHQMARMGIMSRAAPVMARRLQMRGLLLVELTRVLQFNYADWNIGTEGCDSTRAGLYGQGLGIQGRFPSGRSTRGAPTGGRDVHDLGSLRGMRAIRRPF